MNNFVPCFSVLVQVQFVEFVGILEQSVSEMISFGISIENLLGEGIVDCSLSECAPK